MVMKKKNTGNPEKERYSRIAPFFDLMEFLPEKLTMVRWRKELFSYLKPGQTLELGVGTGKNLPYYPPETPLVAVDISRRMIDIARKKTLSIPRPAFAVMNAEELTFLDHSFENVVVTFVFCSVSDPLQGLRELRRVVQPDGQVLFLEHVLPGNPFLKFLFNALNPLVVRIFGANINRRTVQNITRAGFSVEKEMNLGGDIVKLIVARP